jgi:hypothetical protein
MMRRTMRAVIMVLLVGVAYGQVKLKLPDTTAISGSSLVLPIMVEDFKHIGSFSLIISFDKNVLTYTEVTGIPKFGIFNATSAAAANNNGAVALSWFNVSPSINIQNGKLLDLHFTYKKGTSPLTFVKMVPSSVTDSLATNLPATVKNGKVSARTALLGKKRMKAPSAVK